ncbi:MAG: acetyl-CoA hydrolase/transferase C-terminal domain-containing protein [Chloroflexota bacterium]|nr:acetyl-CoA hydrolase/transferase C-terminal domain-containing protein [Chloroflexota bacterium]
MTGEAPRIVSAAEAIGAIKPGDMVFIEGTSGEPRTLVDALAEDHKRLKGTHLLDSRVIPNSPYAKLTDYFHIITIHVNPDLRDGVQKGYVDFIPVALTQTPKLFTTTVPLDVALVHVSPPDDNGYVSFGCVPGFNRDAAKHAKTVIAQMNKSMPYTFGDSLMPLSDIDYIVEVDRPVQPWPDPTIGPEEDAVAKVVGERISDGDTLCIGVGAIPEALVKTLKNRKHLGLHTGMISDSAVDLMESGVVTNERKAHDTGKTVSGAAVGSERLFKFIHRNPQVEMYPYTYTHDPNIISKFDNFITIVSAIEMDLTGQINSETVKGVQISAVGGLAEWLRGAAAAPNGRSIIAFTSSIKGKTSHISRIIPRLGEGTITSVPRYDVDCIATEYGMAELRGKTLNERAKSLIAIAHPDFREGLEKAWRGIK